jgi:hypothetical protein
MLVKQKVEVDRRGTQQRHYRGVLEFGAKTASPDIVKAIRGGFLDPLIIPRNIARFPL